MPVRVKSAAISQPFGLPQPPAGWPQKPPGISLCMIVKNEERFLERCLSSVAQIVDEINIVDTGSSDRTVEIAERFGARVVHREWRDDFGWARNEALAMATKRWIFQLDADEELLEESYAALRTLKNTPAHLKGVWIRCSNRSNQYRGGQGGVSHLIVRLFPNHSRIRYYGAIHEFPSLDGSEMTLPAVLAPIDILHHGYLDEVMESRDKFARNLSIIEASTQQNPEDAFNWYNLGVTAYLAGDFERCVCALLRMREISRERGARAFVANGLTVLADALTDRLQRPAEGLQYALEAAEMSPRYCNAHFSAGRALEDLRRYDEARAMFKLAIEDGRHLREHFVADEDVPVWKAQNCIAGTYIAEGNDRDAVIWLEEALRNSPKVQPPRHNLACALERLGRVDEAENAFRALRDDFSDEISSVNYANFLLRHGKFREAIAVIEADVDAFQSATAAGMLAAAAAIVQRNGWGDGSAYLPRARELAPQSAEIAALVTAMHCIRAQEAIANGNFAAALSEAQEGLRIAPADGSLRYNAAIACANVGRSEEALAHLENIDTSNFQTYERAQYLKAVLLREQRDYAAALEALQRFESVSGPHIDVLLLKGSLFEALGKVPEAEAVLRNALAVDKRRAAVELGGFYLRAGRFADAQRVAEEALA